MLQPVVRETLWRSYTTRELSLRRRVPSHCALVGRGGGLFYHADWAVAGASPYGRLPTILSISSRPNARIVMVRTFPCMAVPSDIFAAVSPFATSVTTTRSYSPIPRQATFTFPPHAE